MILNKRGAFVLKKMLRQLFCIFKNYSIFLFLKGVGGGGGRGRCWSFCESSGLFEWVFFVLRKRLKGWFYHLRKKKATHAELKQKKCRDFSLPACILGLLCCLSLMTSCNFVTVDGKPAQGTVCWSGFCCSCKITRKRILSLLFSFLPPLVRTRFWIRFFEWQWLIFCFCYKSADIAFLKSKKKREGKFFW